MNKSVFIFNEQTVHRSTVLPEKLMAFRRYWWITKRFWKASSFDDGMGLGIKQSNCASGPWEPCAITDEFSKQPEKL